MKVLVIFNLLFWQLIRLTLSSTLCEYSPQESNFKNPEALLQKIGDDYLLMETQKTFYIPENGVIELYCSNGFRTYNNYYNRQHDSIQSVSAQCQNGNIQYYDEITYNILEDQYFCNGKSVSFYQTNELTYCGKTAFVYGITIKNTSIVLADFCYDIRSSNLMFVHYFATFRRSLLLNKQDAYNPKNMSFNFETMKKFFFPNKLVSNDNENFILPPFSLSTEYQLHKLVSFEKYVQIFEKFLDDNTDIIKVNWWTSLLNENWRIFERLLENEVQYHDVEVFAGKSGTVNEMVHVTGKSIPLLIWCYVKFKTSKPNHEDVVIIGVNSPFIEVGNNNLTIMCTDICDEVPWLEPLSKSRKMPVFGYIFCCKPDEVKKILDGFPIIDHSFPRIMVCGNIYNIEYNHTIA